MNGREEGERKEEILVSRWFLTSVLLHEIPFTCSSASHIQIQILLMCIRLGFAEPRYIIVQYDIRLR